MISVLLILGFVAGLALSFLFSGMESGITCMDKLRIRRQAKKGDRHAEALLRYMEDAEYFLWTILVGNTLANFLIVAPLLIGLRKVMHGNPLIPALMLLVLLLVIYTFCDLLPKMLYRKYPNRLTVISVRPYRLFHWMLSPLVVIVSGLADLLLKFGGGEVLTGRMFSDREEMRRVMQASGQNLSSEERSMIDRVMELQNNTLSHMMIPLQHVVSISADSTIEDAIAQSRETRLLRMPVFDEQKGRKVFLGALNLKPLLYDWESKRHDKVRQHLTGVMHLPEDMTADDALRKMQEAGQRVGLVMNAQKKEVGWVNIRDILKTVFGEVHI
ncbi:MAG: CNNM domain-containing protein [Verrucomicrobiota bacterium]|jgi:putative hemolysin